MINSVLCWRDPDLMDLCFWISKEHCLFPGLAILGLSDALPSPSRFVGFRRHCLESWKKFAKICQPVQPCCRLLSLGCFYPLDFYEQLGILEWRWLWWDSVIGCKVRSWYVCSSENSYIVTFVLRAVRSKVCYFNQSILN